MNITAIANVHFVVSLFIYYGGVIIIIFGLNYMSFSPSLYNCVVFLYFTVCN